MRILPALMIGWLALPAGVSACSCVAPGNLPRPHMVVLAQATAARYDPDAIDWEGMSLPAIVVELKVHRAWYRRSQKTMVVLTGMSGADCGFDFALGGEYLIPMYKTDDGWSSGSCTGILAARQAEEEIRALGRGYRPALSITPGPAHRSHSVWVIGLISSGAMTLLLLAAVACDTATRGRRSGST